MASVKGKLGERDCVLKHPSGYVYIYFGARWKYVEALNDATRFSEDAAKHWIEYNTFETYDKTTLARIEDTGDTKKCGYRPSTEYTILKIETTLTTV
jgi:hypothetical protein